MRLAPIAMLVAGVLGALIGQAVGGPLGVVSALGAAAVLVAFAYLRERAIIRRRTAAIRRWLGRYEHQPLDLRGARHWRGLAGAINELGAAYARRGRRLQDDNPWRRDLVGSLAGPAMLFSPESRLVAANEEARSLLTIPAETGLSAIQALGNGALAGAVREARETGRRVRVDTMLGVRELSAVASPVGPETLLIVTDRTEQRRTEALRRDFVVNASHELKTPAAAIASLADALAVTVGRDPARAAGLVERLGTEADRLVKLVHDLLDLRRLEEAGPLERVAVELGGLAAEVVDAARGRADEYGVELELDVAGEAYVAGVRDDLRLALTNLVDNAIKYNRPGGRVRVVVSPGAGEHEVVVADTGVGIPQQDLRRIFERFYRVDVGRSRDMGGTGLGLAIVRHAIERHGGRVDVESLLGEGTTFTVRLPLDAGDGR